jgi:hypothetical protein
MTTAKKAAEVKPKTPAEQTQIDPAIMQAVSRLESSFTDLDLARVTTFDDAAAAVAETYGDMAVASEELGSGFHVLDNKDVLIGVPLILMRWVFNEGDYGVVGFVSIATITAHHERFILNDGGTGIRDQLLAYSTQSRRFGGLRVDRGLSKSEYSTCPGPDGGKTQCGKPMRKYVQECPHCGYSGEQRLKGWTYYLDLAPV